MIITLLLEFEVFNLLTTVVDDDGDEEVAVAAENKVTGIYGPVLFNPILSG
ncbi:unnamed protein product [Schistosoma curassoni]|uniref:Uncharacterized protein n=1 Tax=Schistosoma curassoni TaxID=6186 RepID=A0A183KFR3_9TREM|nr:unnamed protein product [Schistosoma curassoni]